MFCLLDVLRKKDIIQKNDNRPFPGGLGTEDPALAGSSDFFGTDQSVGTVSLGLRYKAVA